MKAKALILAAAGAAVLGGVMIGLSPSAPEAAFAPTTRADAFGVDGLHSAVVFKVGYMGVANFYGVFEDVSGEYALDLDNPSASSIDIVVKTESVDSNSADRDKHLRGADFFSAKEFPEIRFVGKTFEAAGENKVKVTGDLTLRGVTQEVTTVVEWFGGRDDPRGGYRSGWEATFEINRSEFGVNYGIQNGALGDKTSIVVAITGLRQ